MLRNPVNSEDDVTSLLNRLNDDPKLPPVKRVIKILELLVKAEELRSTLYRIAPEDSHSGRLRRFPTEVVSKREYDDEHLRKWHEEYEACLSALMEELSRYRWHYVIWDTHYLWLQKMDIPDARDKELRWEHEAVMLLLSELQGRRGVFYPGISCGLARYRRCASCSRWFHAKTDHQRFCSGTCRQKNASKDESFKETRRAYMRKRRAEEKAANERALRSARRELRKR
jgi:hypothetical protein